MRASIVLLVGVVLLAPSFLLLQHGPSRWSLFLDATGLTLGGLGTAVVLVGAVMALWRVIRGRQ